MRARLRVAGRFDAVLAPRVVGAALPVDRRPVAVFARDEGEVLPRGRAAVRFLRMSGGAALRDRADRGARMSSGCPRSHSLNCAMTSGSRKYVVWMVRPFRASARTWVEGRLPRPAYPIDDVFTTRSLGSFICASMIRFAARSLKDAGRTTPSAVGSPGS